MHRVHRGLSIGATGRALGPWWRNGYGRINGWGSGHWGWMLSLGLLGSPAMSGCTSDGPISPAPADPSPEGESPLPSSTPQGESSGTPVLSPTPNDTANPTSSVTPTPMAPPTPTPFPTPPSEPTSIPTPTLTPDPFLPTEAMDACALLQSGSVCTYAMPDGEVTGTCQQATSGLVCVADPLPPSEFDMHQTLSDGAQERTIAFDGLGMITGNLEAQSFFPPGKVADYWGFQFLRDNDPDNMGHNTDFLTRISNNMLYILTAEQLGWMKELAIAQVDDINLYAYERYPLMAAFRLQLDKDFPSGTTALSPSAVLDASRTAYVLDGELSFARALLYARIYRSLSADQRAYLDAMVGVGFNSWPAITQEQVKEQTKGLSHDQKVAVMTFAGDLFSWYAGNLDADVYFCPERQGTYYGSFYMKDAPAIGHEGYGINEQMTADAGQAFLDELATTGLDTLVTSLVDVQRDVLYADTSSNIVQVREQISQQLRRLITWEEPSMQLQEDIRAEVLARSAEYGELDGSLVYHYATAFAQVNWQLNATQRQNLMDLRQELMSGTYSDGTPFDYSVCTTYFLYSAEITDPAVLDPYLQEATTLFE